MTLVRACIYGLTAAAVTAATLAAVKQLRATKNETESATSSDASTSRTSELLLFTNSDARRVDLNHAGIEELAAIAGIDSNIADRIIENRPYRNKMDLLSRMVVPQHIYRKISNSIMVSEPRVGVKVA